MSPNKEAEFRQQPMFTEDQDGNLTPNPNLVGGDRDSGVASNPPIQETDVPRNEQPQQSEKERTKGRVFAHFSNPDP